MAHTTITLTSQVYADLTYMTTQIEEHTDSRPATARVATRDNGEISIRIGHTICLNMSRQDWNNINAAVENLGAQHQLECSCGSTPGDCDQDGDPIYADINSWLNNHGCK